jgi:hypothetical protein
MISLQKLSSSVAIDKTDPTGLFRLGASLACHDSKFVMYKHNSKYGDTADLIVFCDSVDVLDFFGSTSIFTVLNLIF